MNKTFTIASFIADDEAVDNFVQIVKVVPKLSYQDLRVSKNEKVIHMRDAIQILCRELPKINNGDNFLMRLDEKVRYSFIVRLCGMYCYNGSDVRYLTDLIINMNKHRIECIKEKGFWNPNGYSCVSPTVTSIFILYKKVSLATSQNCDCVDANRLQKIIQNHIVSERKQRLLKRRK